MQNAVTSVCLSLDVGFKKPKTILLSYLWPSMDNHITDFLAKCDKCQKTKKIKQKIKCFTLNQCKCLNINSVPKYNWSYSNHLLVQLLIKLPKILLSERDSLTLSALACHAADPGSNPAKGIIFSINN